MLRADPASHSLAWVPGSDQPPSLLCVLHQAPRSDIRPGFLWLAPYSSGWAPRSPFSCPFPILFCSCGTHRAHPCPREPQVSRKRKYQGLKCNTHKSLGHGDMAELLVTMAAMARGLSRVLGDLGWATASHSPNGHLCSLRRWALFSFLCDKPPISL